MITAAAGATPAGSYRAWAEKTLLGSVTICLKNEDSSSHSDAVILRFTVVKGTDG